MEYNETNIELLLPRYCEGIATVEEQRLVKDWMKESEENRRIVKQMEILYLAADTVHVINNVNTEKALEYGRIALGYFKCDGESCRYYEN